MTPRLLSHVPSFTRRWVHSTTARLGKAPPDLLRLTALSSDTEHKLAREWLDGFKLGDIPPTAIEKSFARSSGPGGQVGLFNPHPTPTTSSQLSGRS